jgi:hypothetical protein
MNQPEENREKSPKTDAVLSPRELRHSPTANPMRTKVEPQGVEHERGPEGPEPAKPPREER